jgi:hypothetical protein
VEAFDRDFLVFDEDRECLAATFGPEPAALFFDLDRNLHQDFLGVRRRFVRLRRYGKSVAYRQPQQRQCHAGKSIHRNFSKTGFAIPTA